MSDVPCSFHLTPTPATRYREYAPAPALKPYLVCAWTLDVASGTRPHRQRVLPDGCADIIWMGDKPPIVVGPMTRSILSTAAPGTTFVGLRFRPGAAARVLGVPAHEIVDQRVDLSDLWRRQDVTDASHRLLEQRTTAARVAVAHSLLMARRDEIGARDVTVDVGVAHVSGGLRIDKVARALGLSQRQLQRRFLVSVGYGPKTFQRIVRFQRLLAIAESHPSMRLDHVAQLSGYADQAHMTREVGQFSSVTPSVLLGKVVSALALSDLLTSQP